MARNRYAARKVIGTEVSDQELQARFYRPGENAHRYGEKVYSVVFPDASGASPFTSVRATTYDNAMVYAREYGMRFLNGALPIDLRWCRPNSQPKCVHCGADFGGRFEPFCSACGEVQVWPKEEQ